MLKKCLRYDLQAVGRLWCILSVISLGAALVTALAVRIFLESMFSESVSETMSFLSIIGMLGAGLCLLAMIATFIASLFLVYWRTYTNFFTDEGYLTFTLPVKRSTLYLSKVLADAIVGTATLLVFVLGLAFILLIAPPTEGGGLINPLIYEGLGMIIKDAWIAADGWLIPWILVLIPALFASQLYSSGLVFLAMTMGSVIAKKHKLLAAIGLYFAVTAGVSFVTQILSLFLGAGVGGVLDAAAQSGSFMLGLATTVVILIGGLVMACAATVVHFITLHLLENKLNLA